MFKGNIGKAELPLTIPGGIGEAISEKKNLQRALKKTSEEVPENAERFPGDNFWRNSRRNFPKTSSWELTKIVLMELLE